ncbi:MAG: hypothetical protein ACM4D3_18715 [Candidatus Sericytochromatia bacterium]
MTRIPLASTVAIGSIAAALVFGAGAPGHTAVANAKDNDTSTVHEWDIEAYDNCVRDREDAWQYQRGALTIDEVHAIQMGCCDESGGVWSVHDDECYAPAADAQPSRQRYPASIPTTVMVPPPAPDGPTAPLPGSVK